MITCPRVRDRLDDYLGDALPLPERHAIEAHLAACAGCRAERDALEALRAETAALPVSIEPPRDIWMDIDHGIDALGGHRLDVKPRRSWRRFAVAAAVILAVGMGSSLITVWLMDRPQDAAGPFAVEVAYVQATTDLERVLAERRDRLHPETVAVLERSLALIDDAIEEARAALAKDPGNDALADRLRGVHAMKLDLLQRAVKL